MTRSRKRRGWKRVISEAAARQKTVVVGIPTPRPPPPTRRRRRLAVYLQRCHPTITLLMSPKSVLVMLSRFSDTALVTFHGNVMFTRETTKLFAVSVTHGAAAAFLWFFFDNVLSPNCICSQNVLLPMPNSHRRYWKDYFVFKTCAKCSYKILNSCNLFNLPY